MKQGQKQTIKTDKAYFLTLTVVGWIDVFTRKNHRDALIESIKYCQKKKDYEWIYSSASNYPLRRIYTNSNTGSAVVCNPAE